MRRSSDIMRAAISKFSLPMILIVLLSAFVLSCSHNQTENYIEENLISPPEYLEETYLATQTTQETIERYRITSIQIGSWRQNEDLCL